MNLQMDSGFAKLGFRGYDFECPKVFALEYYLLRFHIFVGGIQEDPPNPGNVEEQFVFGERSEITFLL